jgi:TATA-binding protein-associated factor
VRETAAQALGAVARALTTGQTRSVLQHLKQLTSSQEWCVRHGGFLGLKYLLAARQEFLEDLLPTVLPLAIAGLQVFWPALTFWPHLLPAATRPSLV